MTNQNIVLDQFHVQYESTELIFEFSFIVFTLILFVPYFDKKTKIFGRWKCGNLWAFSEKFIYFENLLGRLDTGWLVYGRQPLKIRSIFTSLVF